MTLRIKTFVVVAAILISLLLVLYFGARMLLLRGFAEVEERGLRTDVERARNVFDDEITALERKAVDWAAWDETYQFVKTGDPDFAKRTFTPRTFTALGINLLAVFDVSGRLVAGQSYDLTRGELAPVPAALLTHFSPESPLLCRATTRTSRKGCLSLPGGMLLLTSFPILTSHYRGPCQGTLVMGRHLDARLVTRLAKVANLHLTAYPLGGNPLPPEVRDAIHTGAPVVVRMVSPELATGYAVIHDLTGRPSLVLGIEKPRDVYAQGEASVGYVFWSWLAVGLLVMFTTMWLLERMVLSRLSRLSAEVSEIGSGGALSARVSVTGTDELSRLGGAVNAMLEALEQSQRELQQQQTLLASEEQYRQLIDLSPDSVFIYQDGRCVFANAAGVRLLGAQSVDELLGTTVMDVTVPTSVASARQRMHALEQGEDAPRSEEQFQRLDGSIVAVEVVGCPIQYHGLPAAQIVAHDITERKQAEERLSDVAYHDALTGLPNRLLFNDRLHQVLARGQRGKEQVAVIVLDLDRFKEINDSLGHDMGDHVLQVVAQRLQECIRKCDTVARASGDEFFLILPQIVDVAGAEMVARRVLAIFDSPVQTDGQDFFLTASLGIALFPGDGEHTDTLVKNADLAMYKAKAQGGSNFSFFSQDMSAAIEQRRTLENHLRRALDHQELQVYYQPQVHLASGRVVGMEALVRWQHPEWGLVAPGRFIPLAEETGLITPLGEWVLQTACAQNFAWQQAGLPPLRIAVNVSARQFLQKELVETILRTLESTGLAPSHLELEITESTAMHNSDHTLAVLRRLYDYGINIAIDDFGTGYSSLSYLKKFPVHTLKIDRTFIQDVLLDADSAAIVEAIIAMTHSLKRKVIAEAVETLEQLQFLQAHQCDEVQGYFLGHPVPAEEFVHFITQQTPPASQ